MPRIEKGNIPGYKKKVMLISATPMNNTPADIYNEIQLFQFRYDAVQKAGRKSA